MGRRRKKRRRAKANAGVQPVKTAPTPPPPPPPLPRWWSRRLAGFALERAKARPRKTQDPQAIEQRTHTIMIALWSAAGLVWTFTAILPGTPFARWIGPWLVVVLGGAAVAWTETTRHALRTAVAPVSTLAVVAVLCAYLVGARAGVVTLVATSVLSIGLLAYASDGARARTDSIPENIEGKMSLVFSAIVVLAALAVLGAVHG